MATFHFYLRAGGKVDEPVAIHFHVHWSGRRLVYPTGCKVVPKHWDIERERCTGRVPTCSRCSPPASAIAADDTVTRVIEAHREISSRLERIQADAVRALAEYGREHNRNPELGELRNALKEADGQPTGGMPLDVFGYFQAFNERRLGQVNRHSTKPLHPTLHGRNRKALEYLKEFVMSRNKGRLTPLHFSNLNRDFVTAFQSFLTKEKGFAVNTIGKYLRAFRELLNDAARADEDLQVPRSVLQRGSVPIPEEETTQIYLNPEELDAMVQLELSGSPRLDRARDLFIVGAWTGLRFGDLSRVRPEHVEGAFLRVPTAKTGKEVRIPLNPRVVTILEKHGGRVPSGISNQKQNCYIKEVASMIPALKEKVMAGKTKGGVRREVAYSKWELVTTHTARRSFATNMYRQNIPARTIMAVTGHTTERAFQRYIRLTVDEHMDMIRNSPLFSSSTLKVA